MTEWEIIAKLHDGYRGFMIAGRNWGRPDQCVSCDCMCHDDDAEWGLGELEIHKEGCMAAPDWPQKQLGPSSNS